MNIFYYSSHFTLLFKQLKTESKSFMFAFWRFTFDDGFVFAVCRLPFAVYPVRKIEGDSARRIFAVCKSCSISLLSTHRTIAKRRPGRMRRTRAEEGWRGKPLVSALWFSTPNLVPLRNSLTRYLSLMKTKRLIASSLSPCEETAAWYKQNLKVTAWVLTDHEAGTFQLKVFCFAFAGWHIRV